MNLFREDLDAIKKCFKAHRQAERAIGKSIMDKFIGDIVITVVRDGETASPTVIGTIGYFDDCTAVFRGKD